MRQPWLAFIARHRVVTILLTLFALVMMYYWVLGSFFTQPIFR
jgi:uncharacterized membrane protein affecting hemolysin expression